MNEISRRRFLQVAGSALVAIAAIQFWEARETKRRKAVAHSSVPGPTFARRDFILSSREVRDGGDAMRAEASRRMKADILRGVKY
jgi:hypothetical protein